MKPLSMLLAVSACAVALAAAPTLAQDDRSGPGPDGAPAEARPAPAPGTPQDGPDGAPTARPRQPGMPAPEGRGPGGPAVGRHGPPGPWGRSGPSPEIAEKMQKVEELDGKLWPLIQKMRTAPAKDKAAVKAELRKAIAALFDAHLALAEEAQKSHEKQAAEMKARIAKRKAQREALIDKKLSEAVGEDDDDWDY